MIIQSTYFAAVVAISTFAVPMMANTLTAPTKEQKSSSFMADQVRKTLVSLPNYGVFDDLKFNINGPTVTLTGYASRPTLKTDAERAVSSIEGVQSVINRIEALPLSQMDDRIRFQAYKAIYGNPSLHKYSVGSGLMPRLIPLWAAGGITNNPPTGWNPIHIVVNNGHVTLTGTVDRDMDKTIAGMAANRVFGVFSVTNDLAVASAPATQENTEKAAS
jgi:hyperosmotically inducible protein